MSLPFFSCHRKPERSFSWSGKQFPVCARCTGFYLGFLAFPFFYFGWWQINSVVAVLLVLPTVADALTQASCKRESYNWLRFTTGLAAGAGLTALAVNVGVMVGSYFF
jgi:uncharacterized membrane protein